ncbi:MAG: 50S ribosomal protein L29 [Candidatus Cloacimonadaceae bacterium]|jgi:large subunit ribosomal protein L29|nr:50S ribosomal protein L29 [Candidatus Cloacimonadota bacterium]MDY0127494.1 50S ribosomal protein L29 [Candidatus Cloacimonadaceae bacterium]MCB5254696.1 50S ribosomal protein L29 [Candidatus Cloacimonadota bacterium]MCK9177951.1 50S ribosomal protein L29 [Candidatus Cloacimonadota bacterium]MCK9243398.1 50S ribosomal protein L29 [Candidatus Cloacimonadota bacterium]
MKTEEIRDLSIHEMQARIEELRIELFNLRFQKARNLLDRPDRMRIARREIARINTIMKEKELKA